MSLGLGRYLDAGATDLLLMPIPTGPDPLRRVCEVAAGIVTADGDLSPT